MACWWDITSSGGKRFSPKRSRPGVCWANTGEQARSSPHPRFKTLIRIFSSLFTLGFAPGGPYFKKQLPQSWNGSKQRVGRRAEQRVRWRAPLGETAGSGRECSRPFSRHASPANAVDQKNNGSDEDQGEQRNSPVSGPTSPSGRRPDLRQPGETKIWRGFGSQRLPNAGVGVFSRGTPFGKRPAAGGAAHEMRFELGACGEPKSMVQELVPPVEARAHVENLLSNCFRARWSRERTVPSGISNMAETVRASKPSTALRRSAARSFSGRRSISSLSRA